MPPTQTHFIIIRDIIMCCHTNGAKCIITIITLTDITNTTKKKTLFKCANVNVYVRMYILYKNVTKEFELKQKKSHYKKATCWLTLLNT